MRNLIVIFIVALKMQGCAVTPTDETTIVRSIDNDSDYECTHLGFVTGSGPMGWTTAHDAEGAMYDVQNKAVELGGNAVRMLNIDSDVATTVITADVYKCEFTE